MIASIRSRIGSGMGVPILRFFSNYQRAKLMGETPVALQ
jgi:hypothetical protein